MRTRACSCWGKSQAVVECMGKPLFSSKSSIPQEEELCVVTTSCALEQGTAV